MITPKVMMSPDSLQGYGYGWELRLDEGKRVIGHSGGLTGFKSKIVIRPDDQIGIIIMSNAVSQLEEEAVRAIIEVLSKPGKTNWDTVDESLQRKDLSYPWDNEITAPVKLRMTLRSGMEGFYEDAVYGHARISEKEGKAFIELIPSRELLSGFVYELTQDTFTIVFRDPFLSPGELVFERDTFG